MTGGGSNRSAQQPGGQPSFGEPVIYGPRRHPDPEYFNPILYKIPEGSRAMACVRMNVWGRPDYYSTKKPEQLRDKISDELYTERMEALNLLLTEEGYPSLIKMHRMGLWTNAIGWAIFFGGLVAGFMTGDPLWVMACVICKIVVMWMPMSAPYVEMVKETVDKWNEEDKLAGRNWLIKALPWRNGELQSLLTVTINYYEYEDKPLEGVTVEALPVYEKGQQ
ncbi:UNVERIFIED_CONTAM: hypothetical protein HDU68_010615 [Siphonaria sp. JEL0065]|nr:hypothetical protein HDU68_010615 [Siphonaria sp. JEL0065]